MQHLYHLTPGRYNIQIMVRFFHLDTDGGQASTDRIVADPDDTVLEMLPPEGIWYKTEMIPDSSGYYDSEVTRSTRCSPCCA